MVIFAEHLGRCIYDGIYVGDENKTIATTDGIRNDIIEALRELHIPNLRWPGGCFADIYHWKDGIGPKDQRKPTENVFWGNLRESNEFGTHEFLDLCGQLGAEPYLAINMNSGSVQEAMEWEQYVNSPNGASFLTDLRAQNGRDEPWNVKYWGIGNESWGCGGNMTAEYYSSLYNRYAAALTTYETFFKPGNLFRIAVGPSTYLRDTTWTETLMKSIPLGTMEGLSLHHYCLVGWPDKGSSFDFTTDIYYKTMRSALYMDEFITRNSKIMDKYDPDKKVGLIVDEWGGWYNEDASGNGLLYQQNTIRDAMIAGVTLNIFNNHADRVYMANLAQTVNALQAVILTKGEQMILTPTYHVMNMYKVHQDATLVPAEVSNMTYLTEGQIPAVSVSASLDAVGKMHISLTNIDDQNSQPVKMAINGFKVKNVTGEILTSDQMQDHNAFENPTKVKPRDFSDIKVRKGNLEVNLPPVSVLVLELIE